MVALLPSTVGPGLGWWGRQGHAALSPEGTWQWRPGDGGGLWGPTPSKSIKNFP